MRTPATLSLTSRAGACTSVTMPALCRMPATGKTSRHMADARGAYMQAAAM